MHLRAKRRFTSERAKGQSNLARTRGGRSEEGGAVRTAASSGGGCHATLPLPTMPTIGPTDRATGHVTWAATPNPFFHLARTAETNGSIMRAANPAAADGMPSSVVDDASVPVFLRIANLFKRPALIRIQEAKREEEGRQEGGIHPRPGLASFVVLGAAAGSRES